MSNQRVYPALSRGRKFIIKRPLDTLTSSVVPWYLSGDIPSAACLAAYKPKWASSQSASYLNLAVSGSNNLSVISGGPTWNASVGWSLVANQGLLMATGWIFTKPFTFIARITPGGTPGSERSILSGDNNSLGWQLRDADKLTANKIGISQIGGYSLTAVTTDKVVGISFVGSNNNVIKYLNGVADGTGTTSTTFSALTRSIGRRPLSTGVQYVGDIALLAIYNIELSADQHLAVATAALTF